MTCAVIGLLLLGAVPADADDPTMARVHAAQALACGVVAERPDYNRDDQHGRLDTLGIEICKAVAVAVLSDPTKMRPTTFAVERLAFEALRKGAVEVVVGVTPSASDAWLFGVRFGPPVFYDGQGFIVRKDAGIASANGLAGKMVCFIAGTDLQRVLGTAMRSRGIKYMGFPFGETGEMASALLAGRCNSVTGDVSRLAELRAGFHGQANDFVILSDTLTLEPVAPAYRQGDAQWSLIVDWTVYALLQAEASGVTQANVATMSDSEDIAVQRLLGVDWAAARALGLNHAWAARVIATVGNYGEIYARTVGEHSPLRLQRGLNAVWTQGGLMYALPVR